MGKQKRKPLRYWGVSDRKLDRVEPYARGILRSMWRSVWHYLSR